MDLLQALEIPAIGPDGFESAWQTAARRLAKDYFLNRVEMERIAATRSRKHFLLDQGEKEMEKMVRNQFADPGVQQAHINLLPFTKYDNALRRITQEESTVYLRSPSRHVGNATDDARYQLLLKAVRQDEVMRLGNHWLNAFNDVLFWFRVRALEPSRPPILDEDDNEIAPELPPVLDPVLEVFSPDQFWAVSHPDDPTHLIAIARDITPRNGDKDKPHYDVWTDTQRIKINGHHRAMLDTLQPNLFKRIPGVLAHKEPRQCQLLDWQSGDDLVAAHKLAWFTNTILSVEAKSISKQAVWIGDAASIPSGQSQRTEIDLHAPEGTGFTTIDRGVDLAPFRETSDHYINRAGANHGIPPSVRNQESASSGFEIQLRERRLRELRTQQIVNFRSWERELAEVQAVVLSEAMPDLAFSTEGWSIDFPEIEVPLSAKEELEVFEKRRKLTLTSTIEYLREKDPDLLSDDAAVKKLEKLVNDELERNTAMRPLQQMNGSTNQPLDQARTPQENGAMGPAARDEGDEPLIQ